MNKRDRYSAIMIENTFGAHLKCFGTSLRDTPMSKISTLAESTSMISRMSWKLRTFIYVSNSSVTLNIE